MDSTQLGSLIKAIDRCTAVVTSSTGGLSTKVPYTGAIADVDLGLNSLIMNGATLDGGSTGTIAVKTDVLFTTTHFHGAATIATTTLFYDKYPSSTGVSSSSGGIGVTVIPFDCTLTAYALSISVISVLGTANAGTISVRVNNTTDIVLTAAALYSTAQSIYSSSALNTNLNAGDYIEIKIVPNCTPTAATNVTESVTLYFKRR